MLQRRDFPRVFNDTGIEPEGDGYYVDRDGDIWEKQEAGWRLLLQRGVAVDPESLWNWTEGHVCDYAPFTPMGAQVIPMGAGSR
ncbi:hypothetical protein JK358_27500 [Nocardia sp. 2]|uniref:Uncharacterized protein n=1 Tax=Nocardia acididurans TaxID=2802282 RepID=A0ABS1MG18_9NOCA|nr:hypothetical protein [Nocardia acididurans]MBL1078158.1 hypothetical protein [Nocardia acididurans]